MSALLLLAACDPKKEDKPTAKAEDKSESKKADGDEADPKKADPKKADPKKADAKKADDKKADPKKADDEKADDEKADDAKEDPETAEDGVLEDGSDQEKAGPVFAEGDIDLSFEKVGELYVGMSGADLEKVLGKPKKKGEISMQEATGDYTASWSYPGKGIEIWMDFADEKGSKPSIGALIVNENCAFSLPWGLNIGSTRAEVEKVYGKNFDPDMTNEDSFIAGSVYWGAQYEFKDGKVVSLFLGAGAE